MAMPRSRKAGTQRPPPATRGHPLERRGREQREPQPAVGGEALLRGEVVGVELRRVDPQPAGGGGGVDGDDAAAVLGEGRAGGALDLHGHAGRGLVVGEGVEVDVVGGDGLGMRPGRGLDDLGVVEMGGGRGGGGELGRELAEGQVLAAPLDQAEGGDVPEARRAAVAEHDLVAVGEREQLAQPGAQPAHHRPHRGLAVAGPEVGRRRRRQRRDLLAGGPSRARCRSARRTASGRRECGCRGCRPARRGQRNRSRACSGCSARVQAWQPWRPPEKPTARRLPGHASRPGSPPCRRRPPWRSTPRPRRWPPPAPTSSGSAPVSPTSRRPRTSSRPPLPRAATRSTTTTPPPPGSPALREAIAAKTARDSGLRGRRRRRCSSPTAPSRRSTRRSRRSLDPGDEVLVPAPYWTTYPEAVALAGGVPVRFPPSEATGFHLTVDALEAARYAGHQGAALRVAQQPHRGGVHARRGRRHRTLGRRQRPVGGHRRDLRAPRLRGPRLPLHAGGGARARRPLHRDQRRGQDLRHDRMAGRLDDRPPRRHRGRHQPPVARHLERLQRRPSAPPWRRSRATSARWPRCAAPSTAGDGRSTRCSTTAPG